MALTRWERLGLDWPPQLGRWFEEPDAWLRVEEIHEERTLVVRAEQPGIDPDEDLDVWVADGMPHISATREVKGEHKGRPGYRSELRYGEFSRTLALPSSVEADAAWPATRTASWRSASRGRPSPKRRRTRCRSVGPERAGLMQRRNDRVACARTSPSWSPSRRVRAAQHRAEGLLVVGDRFLSSLEVPVISLHAAPEQRRDEMTERPTTAVRRPR